MLKSFPLISLHSLHHNDKVETDFFWLHIGIHYSGPTFGRPHTSWNVWRLWPSHISWCEKLYPPGVGDFLTFFFASPFKHCQVGWRTSVKTHKHRVVPQLLLYCHVQPSLFIEDICVLDSVQHSLSPNQWPIYCNWKPLPKHDDQPMLHCLDFIGWMMKVPGFLQIWCIELRFSSQFQQTKLFSFSQSVCPLSS